MVKLIYALWSPEGQSKERTKDLLLNDVQYKLYDAGVKKLTMYIDDEYSTVRSPAPKLYPGPVISAEISLWVDELEQGHEIEKILDLHHFKIAGYLVDEFIYTEYGGNRHFHERDWPDGERSPVVMAVTLMQRPKRLSHEEWIHRWHDRQSPVSEEMQPRARYIRNVVLKPITTDALPFEGIVEEAWPSARHITNPFLFYGAGNIFTLARNMYRMFMSVSSFLNFTKIRTSTMSEYILKS
jgi:hypothetical protein